jgi:hypothetical protein
MKRMNAVIMALIVGGLSSSGAFAAFYDLDADTNERAGGDGADLKEIHYGAGAFQLSAYNFISGSPYDDATKIWAYLDDTGGKDGGGACQTNNCAGSSDDNLSRVTNNEMLGLTLSSGLESFQSMSLWGDHGAYGPDQVLIDLDGFGTAYELLAYNVAKSSTGEAIINLAALGINTDQIFVTAIDDAAGSKLYLSSVSTNDTPPNVSNVPLPAAAWLFGSAMLGLMGVASRKKA